MKYTDEEVKKIIHNVVKNDKEEVLQLCDNREEAEARPDAETEAMLFAMIKYIFENGPSKGC